LHFMALAPLSVNMVNVEGFACLGGWQGVLA